MSLVGGLRTAVSGLLSSVAQADAAAANIVNANTDGYRAQEARTASVSTGAAGSKAGGVGAGVLVQARELGTVDVASEFVTLIQAENAYKASAQVIDTVGDLYKRLIDVRG